MTCSSRQQGHYASYYNQVADAFRIEQEHARFQKDAEGWPAAPQQGQFSADSIINISAV
jgi:hypothetical protein